MSDAEVLLHAEVKGAATLAGFGSAKPDTEELYTTGAFTTYQGRLTAVLRSGYEAGEAVLTVRGAGFEEVSVIIPVK